MLDGKNYVQATIWLISLNRLTIFKRIPANSIAYYFTVGFDSHVNESYNVLKCNWKYLVSMNDNENNTTRSELRNKRLLRAYNAHVIYTNYSIGLNKTSISNVEEYFVIFSNFR